MSVTQSGSIGDEIPTADHSISSELLENIPEDLRDRLAQFITQSSAAEYFSDLLPPPSILAQYEPDVQRIIFDAAVENRKHRAALEVREQRIEFYRRIIGLLFGFVLALVVIISSLHIILSGHSTEGLIGLGVTVMVSATAFIYTDLHRRKYKVKMREPSEIVENPEQSALSDIQKNRAEEGNNV